MIAARENPFQTARIGSLAYVPQETTWGAIESRLADVRWRASVVGPHGSGKTTFLRTLGERLRTAGWQVTSIRLGDERPEVTRVDLADFARLGSRDVLLLDGAGLLGRVRWASVRRATRRAGGLVISAHEEGRLPTLHACRADAALLHRIAGELAPGLFAAEACAAALRAHGGNMRDALLSFYDRCAGGKSPSPVICAFRGTAPAPPPVPPR